MLLDLDEIKISLIQTSNIEEVSMTRNITISRKFFKKQNVQKYAGL